MNLNERKSIDREWRLDGNLSGVNTLHGPALKSGESVKVIPVEQLREAVARAERAEAELVKVESILVAADRVREAYEAMLAKRKLGRLPDFGGQ